MCSPYAAAAAGGLQAGGQILSGITGAANEKRNEAAYTQAAMGSIAAGNLRARDEGTRDAQVLGRQLSTQAAGNVETGGGSAAQVRADTVRTSGQSLEEILTNTGNTVRQDEAQARGAASRGASDATNSLIGAAATVGDSYVKWQGGIGGIGEPGLLPGGVGAGAAPY